MGTQCLNDRFTVTAPGFTSPPTLCGKFGDIHGHSVILNISILPIYADLSPGLNKGDHMYVRASDACNQLAMTQNAAVTFTRAWSIRIDQVKEEMRDCFSCKTNKKIDCNLKGFTCVLVLTT